MAEKQGELISYYTDSKTGWLIDSETRRELYYTVSNVYDNELAKALLRLSWRYAGADLKVGVACPVVFDYTNEDGAQKVLKIRARGAFRLTQPPESYAVYIKNCAPDRLHPGAWYINTSEDRGKPYSRGIGLSTADIVDPGLLRYIHAHACDDSSYWISLNLPIICAKDRSGGLALVRRNGRLPAAERILAGTDQADEQKAFEIWLDMFERGTKQFLASDYLNYESTKMSLGSPAMELICRDLDLMSRAREGARAHVILDGYWPRLENCEVPMEILNEYRRVEEKSNQNTAAAKLLEAGVCCRLDDLGGMLQLCWDAHRYSLGFHLALMAKQYGMAHRFACNMYPRIMEEGMLDKMAEIAFHVGNAGVLVGSIERYLDSTQSLDEMGMAEFPEDVIRRCNDALMTAMAGRPALEDVRRQGFGEPIDMLIALMNLVQTELCAPVPQWDELMCELRALETPPRSEKEDGAQASMETNPVSAVGRIADAIRSEAILAKKKKKEIETAGAAPAEARPSAGAASAAAESIAELNRKVDQHFRVVDPETGRAGEWRVPTDADKGMLQTLKAALEDEQSDINRYRMPLLIYACMAPAKDAIAAAEAYQARIPANGRKPASSDRRWKLAETLKKILSGEAASFGSEIKEDEKPFLQKINQR